jgi:hypothetical protein
MKNKSMIAGVLMAAISVSFAGDVRAEAPAPVGRDTSGVPLSGDPKSSFSERSESKALLLSLLATAVPAALSAYAISESEGSEGASLVLLGSLVVGPSLGHFYAGKPGRALLGMGIRSAALFGLAGAVAMSWDEESAGGNTLAVASLGIGAASIVWDIASAPASARRYNETHGENRLSIGLGPVGSAPGILVAASF